MSETQAILGDLLTFPYTDHTPMRTRTRRESGPSIDEFGVFGAPYSPYQSETTMLLLFLIGAALLHVRPEPPAEARLPTGPLRTFREAWRTISGAPAFWR